MGTPAFTPNRPPGQRLILATAVGFLTILVVFSLRSRFGSDIHDSTGTPDHPSRHHRTVGGGTDVGVSGRLRAHAADRRKAELERLKTDWLARGSDRTALVALIKETIEALWCSNEMIELLDFLRDHGMDTGRFHLIREAGSIFSTPHAAMARIELAHVSSLAFRRYWSYDAGKFCTSDELTDFRNILGDDTAARNASFGMCVNLAKTDPHSAWTTAIGLLPENYCDDAYGGFLDRESGIVPDYGATILQTIAETVPPSTNFRTMIEELPPVPRDLDIGSPLKAARSTLLSRWTKSSPGDASRYILDNLNQLDPVDSVTLLKVSNDLEWIDSHVPRGKHYDRLMDAILDGTEDLNDPIFKEALDRVSDPEIRKRQLSRFPTESDDSH